jgi:uncharacterized membrane protein YccC
VSRIKKFLATFRARVRRHRPQLGLSLRVTVAAVASLALAQFLDLHLPLWAVLTALIVTQLSVGRSLKATIDYLAGTIGGALYGGAIAVLIPHTSETGLLAVLALAVGPMTLAAAINPSLNVAPITAVIVLLVPTITHTTPIASAFDRVLEVGVGALTGLAISFLVLPSTTHRLVIEAAARTLGRMASTVGELLAGLTQGFNIDELHRLQDGIGQALARLDVVGAEAERERSAHLTDDPDIRPLLRTLLRLRHDLVMMGRAAITPLPEAFRARLQSPLVHVGTVAATYMRASATALLARGDPPSLEAMQSALADYAEEVAALRREGLTRNLPGDAAERFFAIGFALEQMHQNFKDLHRCVTEWAASRASSS